MFYILDNNVKPGYASATDISVSLDGQTAVPFSYNPPGTDDYQYNVQVFQSVNMPLQEHTVLVSSTGESSSLLLFNYAVYT